MAIQPNSRKIPWGRLVIVLVVMALIIVGSILWVISNQGQGISIIPVIIFTVLGVIIALLQWLFPIAVEPPASSFAAVHPPPLQKPPIDSIAVVNALPTNASINLATIPPPTDQSPPSGNTAYRSIMGVPPPTDPRTIQQREKAVKEIYSQLVRADSSAIALIGIGGVGKSTLASLVYSHAEEQRRAGQGPFTSPALWLKIDSATVTMADLVGTIFAALGKPLPDLSSLAPHNQAATLYNALNNNGARLIVLDQFENLLNLQTGYALPDRPGVGEWLDAINSQPCRCRILLTSRPWPQGTHGYPSTYMQVYHVTGLEPMEGIDLLRKLGVDAPEADLLLAVERCSGHVYALTLLAFLLRNRHLSLGTFFKNHTYAQLWTGNVARNLLDHIYKEELDAVQRRLLLAFATYREPVALEAAQAIAVIDQDVTTAQIQLALDGLLNQHLLQPSGEGLYQLHAIVTSYARDHFDVSSEQANQRMLKASHARAAHYYQQYASLHCPQRELRRQRSDVQPLVEAVWQLCQAGLWQQAWELMEQEHLSVDLRIWGSVVVLLELYQLLLPLEKWRPSQPERIYNGLGEIYRALLRMDDARYYFDLSLALCKAQKNRWEEGYVLNSIGRIYAYVGDKQQAQIYYEQALVAHKEVGDLSGEAAVVYNLGWIYDDFGNRKLALEKYGQALHLYHTLNDRYNEAHVLNAMGCVYTTLGQLEVAQRYHERALPIFRDLGGRGGEAWTLNNLGRVYENKGEMGLAIDYLEQALSIRREVGNRRGEGSTLNNLGRVYSRIGQRELALEYTLQSLSVRREVGDRHGEGKTLNSLGHCYQLLGDLEEACFCFKDALRIRQALKQKRYIARTLSNLGGCYVSLGRHYLALACFLAAIKLFEESQTLGSEDVTLQWHMELTQKSIDDLAQKVGEEKFAALLTQVEPHVNQIVEKDLQP